MVLLFMARCLFVFSLRRCSASFETSSPRTSTVWSRIWSLDFGFFSVQHVEARKKDRAASERLQLGFKAGGDTRSEQFA